MDVRDPLVLGDDLGTHGRQKVKVVDGTRGVVEDVVAEGVGQGAGGLAVAVHCVEGRLVILAPRQHDHLGGGVRAALHPRHGEGPRLAWLGLEGVREVKRAPAVARIDDREQEGTVREPRRPGPQLVVHQLVAEGVAASASEHIDGDQGVVRPCIVEVRGRPVAHRGAVP